MDNNDASELLSRILDETEADTASTAPRAQATASPPRDPLGGLVADPALLTSLLPTILSVMPQNGTPSNGAKGRAQPIDRHTALLCAVKPYLGERRQATAESVLKLCRLWDALNRAGLSPAMLSGLLGGAPSGKTDDGQEGEVD